MHFEKKNLHNENYENSYTLDGRKLHKLLPRTRKVSNHDNETLDKYVELCTNKKEKILQPRNRNAFVLPKAHYYGPH